MKRKNIEIILIAVLSVTIVFFAAFFSMSFYFKNYKNEETVKVFDKYKEKRLTLCYGNKLFCKKIKYKTQGIVNTNRLGTYTVTYRASFHKKKFVTQKKVTVVDYMKPTLEVTGTFDKVCPNGKAQGVTLKATDNYDGDLSKNVVYKLHGNKIIYKVSDSSGNTTKKEFDVTIKDEEKPTIVLDDGNTIYEGIGSKFNEPGYVAIDNCDGDITKNVKVEGSVDTNTKGTYTLTYTVTDSSSNTNSIVRTVVVYPKNNYEVGITNGKIIYLTFDDGPGPYTANLLDILAKYNVKVTFFVIGTNTNYDNLITREHNEGHTVGLHSYTHRYNVIYTSETAYFNDLQSISDKVKNLTGVESKVIRFPGGSSNTISRHYANGIMSVLTTKVQDRGYRYFDWNISAGDAGGTTNPNTVYTNVVNSIRPNYPNVVLMHDIKPYTVQAISSIIEYGLANGYTFEPLTTESPIVHQNVNN